MLNADRDEDDQDIIDFQVIVLRNGRRRSILE